MDEKTGNIEKVKVVVKEISGQQAREKMHPILSCILSMPPCYKISPKLLLQTSFPSKSDKRKAQVPLQCQLN